MEKEFTKDDIILTPFGGEYPVISSEIENGIEWVLVDRGQDQRTFNGGEIFKIGKIGEGTKSIFICGKKYHYDHLNELKDILQKENITIDYSAKIGHNLHVDPGTKIDWGVHIGTNVRLSQDVVIGNQVNIGDGAIIKARSVIGKNATILHKSIINEDSIIKEASFIGE